jgi:hypothetical protein
MDYRSIFLIPALKGLCHQILYLFWRSKKLNKYFLYVGALKVPDFFSVLLLSYYNSKLILTTLKTIYNFKNWFHNLLQNA